MASLEKISDFVNYLGKKSDDHISIEHQIEKLCGGDEKLKSRVIEFLS